LKTNTLINQISKAGIVFIFLAIGCKNHNQPERRATSQASPQERIAKKQNPIYNLIINKSETAENLRKEFSYDSIVSLTEEEKSNYKKVGLENGLYLTNYEFLKKQIDSIEFQIYYKTSYGSQLEKLVRINRRDTVFNLTLAIYGSDGGQNFKESTEFLNDSIFQAITVHTETAIDNTHLMAYEIDSIVKYYEYDEKLNFKQIKTDSFHIYKKYPTYYKELKDKVFKTWSDIFTINEIKCRWEYEVKYTDETNENSKYPLVDLISQKLINYDTKELLLDLDLSQYIDIPQISISRLEFNDYPQSSFDNIKDINADGYHDIQFITERAGNGANEYYTSYIFNPDKRTFTYSEVFSDYNIVYNEEKNRLSSYSKAGYRNYYYRFINLKKNKIDIDFIEDIHHYLDTIFYSKKINSKIIEEKKIVLEYEDWEIYLERK